MTYINLAFWVVFFSTAVQFMLWVHRKIVASTQRHTEAKCKIELIKRLKKLMLDFNDVTNDVRFCMSIEDHVLRRNRYNNLIVRRFERFGEKMALLVDEDENKPDGQSENRPWRNTMQNSANNYNIPQRNVNSAEDDG